MPSMNLQAMRFSVVGTFEKSSSKNVAILFAAMICTIIPLDISQLSFALIGALAYGLLQAFSPRPAKTVCQLEAERERTFAPRASPPRRAPCNGSPHRPRKPPAPVQAPRLVVKPEVFKPSSMPVSAPKFASSGWEDEVTELVSQLAPGAAEDQAIQLLVAHVKTSIQAFFPQVEITGFAHGSLTCGKAFGVAVPEVDIVANINPNELMWKLKQNARNGQNVDQSKLQKSAVRICTDRLVAHAGLKFRRSGFRGDEPRVTLLVPIKLGFFTEAFPVDFSINSVTPFYTQALLTECGQIDLRAKSLILLVKRWAKDRGICHAAKGHLAPYLWSLLAMYFMQVGVEEEGPLLPTLDGFKISSNLISSSSKQAGGSSPPPSRKNTGSDDGSKLSVGQLFGKFLHFYDKCFDQKGEVISIRSGQRAPPGLSLPLHVVVSEDGKTHVAPTIEDPFKANSNLGARMNSVSLARFHEELSRANQLYVRGDSLAELLTPWAPEAQDAPEKSSGSSPGEQDS